MFKKKPLTTRVYRYYRDHQSEVAEVVQKESRQLHRLLKPLTRATKSLTHKILSVLSRLPISLPHRHDPAWKRTIRHWRQRRRVVFAVATAFILLVLPTIYLTLRNPKETEAAPWATTAGSWLKRKQVTLTNNSGQTFEANTTYAITINTKELVTAGDLLSSCADLRVYYQPNESTTTKLSYYFDIAAGATNCADSEATKIYFPLQANLSNGASATGYYVYYDNSTASSEASVDAFDVGSKQALMVCPFNGDSECINGDGAESPTTESGAVRYSGGKSALSFDGSNDSVDGVASPSLQITSKVTAEAWVYPSKTVSPGDFGIIRVNNGSTGFLFEFRENDKVQVWLKTDNNGWSTYGTTANSTVPSGQWSHVAFTYQSGESKIYVNGVLRSTNNTVTGNISYSATPLYSIGNWGVTTFFPGLIDEVRISDTVRYTSDFTPQTTPFVRDDNTKLLLHFDENGDDPRNTGKAIDDSGNGNHGTITGAKYVAGLVGVNATTTDTGKTPAAAYASHNGVFIEESTTNKITNPSFDHSTYSTNWNDATNVTETENTTNPYYKFGSKSAKLVASADDSFVISINAGNTNTHTLSAYVYDGTSGNVGGTVSSSIAALVFNGTAQTTTYTDMGGGWWRLTYSGAAGSGSQNYGVQVKSGKTIYVDGVQLEEKAYATTYTDGTLGTGYSWTSTAHESTSSRTAAAVNFASNSNFNTSAGSISLWWKAEINRASGDANRSHSIFRSGDGGCKLELFYFTNYMTGGSTSNIQLQKHIGGACASNKWAYPYTSVVNGNWYHIVATWDTVSGMKLYINNSSPGTDSDTVAPSANTLSIGSGSFLSSDGSVSDLRTYNSVLDATEVADLYYAGLGSHQTQSDYTDRFSGTEAPVVTWHMDEGYGTTVNDSSGKSNSGTISGATWTQDTYVSPPKGKSLQFDGTNDYVYRTYSGDGELDPSTQPFSISTWFKSSSSTGSQRNLISRYNSSGYKLYMNSSGYICFGVDDDSTWSPDDSACSTTSYADSKWHLVTAIRDTSTISVFIDGVQAASTATTVTGHLSGSAPTFYVGIDSDGSSSPWTGFIDEVRIYNHALTTAEILAELSARGSVKGVSTAYSTNAVESTLNQGLVGYWKMDDGDIDSHACASGGSGDTCDASGNSLHGLDSGTMTDDDYVAGKFGTAADFDGTDDSFEFGDVSYIDGEDSVTLAAWVAPDFIYSASSNKTVLAMGNASLRFRATGDSFSCNFVTSVDSYNLDSGITSWSAGEWHHVACVYTGTAISIYWDGSLATSIPATGTINNYTGSSRLGSAPGSSPTSVFDGKIDEARFYSRPLTQNEIQELYEYAPGPVAYLTFDEGSGQSANDKSGNGNTGTLGASSSDDTDDPLWTDGKYSKALSFDGNSDFVTGTNSASVQLTKGTVSAWIKTPTAGSSYRGILTKQFAYGMFLKDDVLMTYDWNSGNDRSTGINLADNSWHYVTLTFDSGITNGTRLWIDGIPVLTTTMTILDQTVGIEIGRGGSSGGTTQLFAGIIDDVQVYNYIRTPQQIVEDMNAGHPAPGSPIGSAVGHWKFDEGYGDTVHDSGSQAKDGNLSGSTSCPSTSICPTWSALGKFDRAVYFGGLQTVNGDSFIVLPNDSYDSLTQGTISMWFKPDDSGDTHQNLFVVAEDDNNNYSDYLEISYMTSTNSIYYQVVDNASTVIMADSASIASPTSWHHLVIVNSLSGNKIYLDGQPLSMTYTTGSNSTDAWFDNVSENVTAYTLGCATADISDDNDCYEDELYQGYLDEVKIYNFDLNEDQVKVEYNQGKAQVLGSLSTASDGRTGDNSASRAYCPPGNVEGNCAAGQNPAPIAHFNFDEGSGAVANDISGNSLTGTISGSATYKSGKYGHGLELGSGKYVTLTGEGSTLSLNSKTISAWIYRTSDSGFDEYIIDNQDANGDGWFMFVSSLDKLECYYNGAQSLSSDSLSVGRWYHIACTTDGSTQKLYLDGAQVDSDNISGSISETNDTRIGARSYTSPSGALNAIVDDLKIYPYARTLAQIAWDYNRGAPAAWYKFDECDGGTLHSSNATYNTALNATWYGSSSGSQTSVGNCDTVGSAWYNGKSGKLNKSLNFDGTDDYVSPGDLSILDNSTQASVSLWFKTSSNPTDQRILFDKGNSLRIEFNNNNLQILTGNGSSWVLSNGEVTYANSQLSTSTWHHAVITFDGQVSSLYVDGKLVDYISDSAFNLGNNSDIYSIGDYGGSHGTYNFAGQIDEVKIYPYALSQQQVLTDYNAGAVHYAN